MSETARPHMQARPGSRIWINALAFLLCALVLGTVSATLERQRMASIRAQALVVAGDSAQSTESRLERLMSVTYLMAAVIRSGQGDVGDFYGLANEILPFYPGVVSLSVSPDGIIRYAAPLVPNQATLGFNQLADPAQSPEAFLARDTGKLTLAGPLQLVQGGLGAVGRLPIFLPAEGGGERFWGFVNVAIRFPDAFRGTALDGLSELGYRYRLYRNDPATQSPVILIASGDVSADHPLRQPVRTAITVPNAEWTLELEPRNGWWSIPVLAGHAIVILAFSVLMSMLAHLLQKQAAHRRQLEARVAERTQDIETARQDLKTTLEAIPDLLFEIDADGVVHNAHAHNTADLIASVEASVGRRIDDLLPPDALRVVREALDEAARQGTSHGKQYELPLAAGPQWFELSVAAKPSTQAGSDAGPTRFVSIARNITARKLSELQYRLSAEFFNGSSEGLVITDAEQRIIQVNPAFTHITGYADSEVLGQRPHVLSSGRHDEAFYQAMWDDIRTQGHWEGEIWNQRRNGEAYPEWLSISRIDNDEGVTTHYVAIFSDISRRLEQEARIRSLAHYDPLTGLANRSLLRDRVQHDLSMARRREASLSLLFIDLDHFKHVNDSPGHHVGDQLLVQIAQRIQSHIREQDTAARLGGDEFVVLLPDTSAQGAAHMARSLLERLSRPYTVGQQELTVTPSIGIAVYPTDGTDFESLYRCADTAMYRAKQEGRSRFAFFTPEMQASSMRRLQLENGLRRAIDRDELWLAFQPQVDLRSGRLMGVEALLRWQHPEWGSIPPGEFIPIAESSGQIIPIGEWVLLKACEQMQQWRQSGMTDAVVAVNLSAMQFRQPDLPRVVRRTLEQTGLPPECLELELTESTAMQNPEQAVATVNALRSLGVTLSVDDFGTGYSSLSYLKRFRIGKLKIDQSFVQGLPDDAEDASIVETIIQMAHSLGLSTIAEGVETDAQRTFLQARGCQQMQGYLLSRPLPPADLVSWWRERLSANG